MKTGNVKMMELYAKKRIEIVVEQIQLDTLTDVIDAAGGSGYTVVRKISGKGNRGVRSGGALPDIFGNVMIIVIASEDVANEIVSTAHEVMEDIAGIISVSDVQVVRNKHF